MREAHFVSNSVDETRALAARLGALLRSGDLLCLHGDLGAGKTAFTQGLALGLGLPDTAPVRSPTFTLLAEHPGGRFPLYHFDVYRLAGAPDLADLAFDEYLEAGGVVVIEWAARVAEALPPERLDVTLAPGVTLETRRITLTPRGARAQELTDALTQ